MRANHCLILALSFIASADLAPLTAQTAGAAGVYTAAQCPSCAEWAAAQQPRRIYGNTYYVGTKGLSSILVTSDRGHVLIDGGIPEAADSIIAHIVSLGFRIEDVKLILNSHAHYDHAGGIAALQRASGAEVAATKWSAEVMKRGASIPGDPQYGILLAFPPVSGVHIVTDGEVMRVGPLALTAHVTPGHTPGGTTWTWRSCEATRCLNLVYADSQTPVSADGFLFTKSDAYPSAIHDFEHGQVTIEELPCDILLTPHPGASQLLERMAGAANAPKLIDTAACSRLAATARDDLARRIASERGKPE